MPNIRALGQTTTSGLMLSPGYGGGTANIEFQQMTGLNMANFSDTLLSPYQQLVATRPKFYSFNQMWNEHCGDEYSTSCSIGYHPFKQFFYLRGVNYKKFGFSHLYTLDSDPKIAHGEAYVGPNGTKTEVSDEEAYKTSSRRFARTPSRTSRHSTFSSSRCRTMPRTQISTAPRTNSTA